ncbi:CHAT domain-containing protein [Sphaerisporangium siamense]|nr:CHAT domain-containing protein [Sphaerisporangium siamense]
MRRIATGDLSPALEEAAFLQVGRAQIIGDDGAIDLEVAHLLGWLHWCRYWASPEDSHLEAAVGMLTPSFVYGIDAVPEPLLPALADKAAPIATEMLQQVLDSADNAPLSNVVELWQRIVRHTPTGHPGRTTMLSNLAIALQVRFERTGVPDDLEQAIEAGREAVQATPTGHPGRAAMLSNLATVLRLQFERIGVPGDLEEAIEAGREALQATPTDHPHRAGRLSELGNALHVRFERIGVMDDLEEAIEAGRKAVQATPTGHPDRAAMLSNLGGALRLRFDRTGLMANLEEAIEASREVLRATVAGHPYHAGRLSNLGIALQARFRRTGLMADLEEAIEAGREALRVAPAGHPDRVTMLSNLAIALQVRFERIGVMADLEEAIEAGREALRAAPAGHLYRATMLSNLGGALQARFRRTEVMADLEQAIEAGREAVRITPTGQPDHAGRLSNLGNALRVRFGLTGAMADLDEAIIAFGEAVQATPAGHPYQAGYLSNLGIALRVRFERTGVVADLERAIETGGEAVRAAPAGHPDRATILSSLGNALQARYQHTRLQSDLDAALSAYAGAAEIDSAPPSTRILAARLAASLCARSCPGRAAALLEEAVRLLPQVAPRRLERSDQQHAIGTFAGLAADAAALALDDPSQPAQRRATRALGLLEAARAVLLSEALHTRSDLTDLRERHPELATRFVELREMLDRPTGASAPALMTAAAEDDTAPYRQTRHDRRHLAEEFATLLDHIRTLEGFASFALPPTTEQLLAQTESGPVVVLNTGHRSDALLLTPGGITTLELPALTHAIVVGQINTFHQALHITTNPDSTRAERIGAQDTIRGILGWLWDATAEPILRELGHHQPPAAGQPWPRVWWAPGGLLSLLPIHAAGHHTDPPGPGRRTVMDRVISSYTPTVGALRHARRRSAAHPGPAHRGLIVAMPTTPGLPDQGRLPNVPAEAATVRAHLPHSTLLAEPDDVTPADSSQAPTFANVLAHLPACTIAHFACHGHSDPADPSASRLLLHDHQTTPLTIAALAPISLDQARLAYLSACSTALIAATTLLDEATQLTTAFQLAGFPHVIGTLWPIDDDIAVTIADAFYTHLTTSDGTLDPALAACALHHAVRSARDEYPATPSLWAAYIHAGA